jgi:hypothetical protein
MHGTVQIRDLFNFFLCCCLSKGTIFHRFLMFVLFTSFYHSGYFGMACVCVIYLRVQSKALAGHCNQAGKLQPTTPSENSQQHEEGKGLEVSK